MTGSQFIHIIKPIPFAEGKILYMGGTFMMSSISMMGHGLPAMMHQFTNIVEPQISTTSFKLKTFSSAATFSYVMVPNTRAYKNNSKT